MSFLSNRAQDIMKNPSMIVQAAVKCAMDPFSEDNPNGYLNFGVAENMLVDDILLEKTSQSYFDNSRYHHYHETFGCEVLRDAFVGYLNHFFYSRTYSADNVIASSGASATLEMLSYVLFNEGDEVVIPTPYYSGFEYDLEIRFKAKIKPFKGEINDNNYNDPEKLISFLKETKPKAILLCQPHNPTGRVYSKSYIKALAEYCEEAKVHLISDEVYFMTRTGDHEVATALEFSEGSNYIHFIYSMAKDFSLGGFKVGYLYSENQELLSACQAVGYFHTPSTHTQLLCAELFKDYEWVKNFHRHNSERISMAFQKLEDNFLKIHCDDYTITQNGFFSFINLGTLMTKLEIKTDIEMFNFMLNELKINILPDDYFGFPQQGYFRLCFARNDAMINEFIKRFNKL